MHNKVSFLDDIELLDISIKSDIDNLWCRELFDVSKLRKINQGEGIKVAVLDTGEPNHKDLNIYGSANFTRCNEYDAVGHSTHICGIIAGQDDKLYGVAQNVELYTVKVLDDNGFGSFNDIQQGIEWCYEHEIHIINLSLGAQNRPNNDKKIVSIIEACNKKGITCISSSGNSPTPHSTYPAHYDGVLSVGAIDSKHNSEEWSCVDCDFVAPSSAYSTHLNNSYARMRGTSQSAAFITGLVACIKSYYNEPFMKYDNVRFALYNTVKNALPYPNKIGGEMECRG